MREIPTRSQGGKLRPVTFLKYLCPEQVNCKDGGAVFFEKSSGYTNPF